MITNLKTVQLKDDVIDIKKSRSLLKPTSQRLTRRAVSSPVQSVSSIDEIDDDDKIILFESAHSKILQFEDSNLDNESSGRMLGSGKFEIYQLHQKRVSYLQCGKSIIYPILPKLKILKISLNQFLVTLSNPERYWRIIIDSNEERINELELVLKSICCFRNLYIKPEPLKIDHPIFDMSSNFSTTSITSEMACLDDKNLNKKISLETIKLDDDTESLDLAFDEFTNLINDTNNTTISQNFKTAYSISTTKTTTISSKSLNFEENNWMELEDEEIQVTSTPNTERYISLNLNPKIIKRDKNKLNLKENNNNSNKSKRNFSDSSFYEIQKIQNKLRNEDENFKNPNEFIDIRSIKQKNRLSSFDVYNILRDVEINDNEINNDNDSSFKGFIKSLF